MPFKGINWKEEIHNAVTLGMSGMTYQQIGQHYGVSKQRIKQVFKQYGVDPEIVGLKVKTKASEENRKRHYFSKWGDKVHSELYQAQRAKFRRKKANAQRTGYTWSVLFGDLVWPTHCPILGIELDYFSEFRKENSPSFDRINSSEGYVKGNVQIVSWRANRIKNDGTSAEHRLIADYLDKLNEMT